MVPPISPSSFFAKVAAARTPAPVDYSPAGDPDGSKAHAFVSGIYAALQKEAGLDPAAACGFLRALAELGAGENHKQAFLDGLKMNPAGGWADNLAEMGNAAFQGARHPLTSMQGINIANHTPLTRTVTNDVYQGNYGDAAGHVAGGIWDAIKQHSPEWLQGGENWLSKNVTPDNLKAIAPHVMAGLGTYAAGRMLGMGNVGSAALGLAGGYGLPKLYDGLAGSIPAAANPGLKVPAAPAAAPVAAAPAQTQAQAAMATSSGTADNIAAKASQPGAAPVAAAPNPPVTGRRVP